MPGQFDKETTRQNFEWHRERILREKQNPSKFTNNRVDYNLKAIDSKHGEGAAKELVKEFNSKKQKSRKYFT